MARGGDGLAAAIDAAARDGDFSGALRVDVDGVVVCARAYGLADRAAGVANTVDTQFGIASGTKGLTALTIVSLVTDGLLSLATRARSVLGNDLPLVGDDVTVEHLLGHRSGIGDYMDEDADLDVEAFALPVPAGELRHTEDYLRVLDGFPPKFAPGIRFSYCNSGYVVLALIAERVTGTSFAELVSRRVCEPAGMRATAFLESDALPAGAAHGYLAGGGGRTNAANLPVRGSGDGGIFSTVGDVHALWDALFAGRIVAPSWVAEMVRPRRAVPEERMRYGLGFWLGAADDAVLLEGFDAGVSFRSVHDPTRRVTYTVVSNSTRGAWPIARLLAARFER